MRVRPSPRRAYVRVSALADCCGCASTSHRAIADECVAFFAAAGLLLAALGSSVRRRGPGFSAERGGERHRSPAKPARFLGQGRLRAACARAHAAAPADRDRRRHAPARGRRPPGTLQFRRLTVYDGDDVSGERCELGLNDNRKAPPPSTGRASALDVRLAAASRSARRRRPRLAGGDADEAGAALQQPASGVDLRAAGPQRPLAGASYNRTIWTRPGRPGVWTRFVFDIVYSQDPAMGSARSASI